MKLTAPKTVDQYFKDTEHAVKHAYAGLASCWQYVEEAEEESLRPVEQDGMLHYLPPRTPEERARLERSVASYTKYFELKISEAMFAGSILEAAYMAIKIYSHNTSIPASCAAFVKPSKRKYFKDTEHAVKHAYAGLASCWQYVEEAEEESLRPVEQDGMLHYLPPRTPEERARLERSVASYTKYFELKISEAMFAGSILEAAYMAIKIYSHNTSIPASCAAFVKPSKRTVLPFCIGPERHGVPTGLIIYAGRNQYAHWGDDETHEVTAAVFDTLTTAFLDNPLADLAFDLGNPTITIYAGEILLTALGWTSYDVYLAEMKDLL